MGAHDPCARYRRRDLLVGPPAPRRPRRPSACTARAVSCSRRGTARVRQRSRRSPTDRRAARRRHRLRRARHRPPGGAPPRPRPPAAADAGHRRAIPRGCSGRSRAEGDRQGGVPGLAATVRRFGEPAPGPLQPLWVPPEPAVIAAQPYWVFHPFGVEQRRAETLRRAAAEAAACAAPTRRKRPGGWWRSAASGRGRPPVVPIVHGDPDAVSVGDFHIPNMVAWALAGEPRADDARLLELLEPFRGHRGRVCRLLVAEGCRPRSSARGCRCARSPATNPEDRSSRIRTTRCPDACRIRTAGSASGDLVQVGEGDRAAPAQQPFQVGDRGDLPDDLLAAAELGPVAVHEPVPVTARRSTRPSPASVRSSHRPHAVHVREASSGRRDQRDV